MLVRFLHWLDERTSPQPSPQAGEQMAQLSIYSTKDRRVRAMPKKDAVAPLVTADRATREATSDDRKV